jgi:hypothetical protein
MGQLNSASKGASASHSSSRQRCGCSSRRENPCENRSQTSDASAVPASPSAFVLRVMRSCLPGRLPVSATCTLCITQAGCLHRKPWPEAHSPTAPAVPGETGVLAGAPLNSLLERGARPAVVVDDIQLCLVLQALADLGSNGREGQQAGKNTRRVRVPYNQRPPLPHGPEEILHTDRPAQPVLQQRVAVVEPHAAGHVCLHPAQHCLSVSKRHRGHSLPLQFLKSNTFTHPRAGLSAAAKPHLVCTARVDQLQRPEAGAIVLVPVESEAAWNATSPLVLSSRSAVRTKVYCATA